MISPFDNLVWSAVDSYGTPLSISREQWFALINSIIQKESNYNPNAVSYTGAGIGLMQVNPQVWLASFGLSREQLFDPYVNIQTGAQIAKNYIQQYGTSQGLGAYFAGPLQRLSASARSYARSVLSIYRSMISKIKRAFGGGVVSAGQSYYLPYERVDTSEFFPDVLPEHGMEIQSEIESQDSLQDDSTFLLLTAGAIVFFYLF